jgi:hypothetical protein
MRLACWRARPRDRELSTALHFFVSITVSVKACFGATPLQRLRSNGQAFQPARETHALPKAREPRTTRDFQIDGE